MSTDKEVVSDRLLNSMWITYSTIASNKGLRYVEDLVKDVHIKRSQVYKHLHYLKLVDFVRIVKEGRRSAVVVWEYFKTKDEFKQAFIERYEKRRNRDIYGVALEIKEKMVEYGICGDLFGAAKIHELIPEHNRMTQDINVVVVNEHAKFFRLLLLNMGYVVVADKSALPYSDITFNVPGTTWSVCVLYDGVKHPRDPNVRYLDLSKVLREQRQIPLEYVLASKFFRYPHLRKKEDSEDIVTVLVSDVNVDLDQVAQIVADVVSRFPELGEVLMKNIDTVEGYVNEYIEYPHLAGRVRMSLNYIRDKVGDLLEESGEKLRV